MRIPKVIHYCWFGNSNLPDSTKKYIETWKKYAPDYKIILWNETNFDINQSEYCRSAYDNNLYAFVTDYARLAIIHKYGGIYLDTDVELLKPIDSLLDKEAFFGLEDPDAINTGLIFGAVPQQKNVGELLGIYDSLGKNIDNGNFIKKSCVKITTEYFMKLGFKRKNKYQIVDNCSIYPTDYFCPQRPGELKPIITQNTITYHHYLGSWVSDNSSKRVRENIRIERHMKQLIGIDFYEYLRTKYKKLKSKI